jgi:twitching motility two-component system response regulator PilG
VSKKKILVVEPENSLIELEKMLLTTKGYEVRGVTSGQAALDALAEEPADLVLLAIMLPDLDGFEVCHRIKSEVSTKHIPVIMLTVKKTRKDWERGQEVCVDDYITKPFEPGMVFNVIQKFLNK